MKVHATDAWAVASERLAMSVDMEDDVASAIWRSIEWRVHELLDQSTGRPVSKH